MVFYWCDSTLLYPIDGVDVGRWKNDNILLGLLVGHVVAKVELLELAGGDVGKFVDGNLVGLGLVGVVPVNKVEVVLEDLETHADFMWMVDFLVLNRTS